MKIDSIGAIVEVMPYYGALDQVYVLLMIINRRTYQHLQNGIEMLSKIVAKRRTISSNKQTLETYLKNFSSKTQYYKLFKIEPIEVTSESQWASLSKFIKYHSNKEFIRMSKIILWNWFKNDSYYWESQYNPSYFEGLEYREQSYLIKKVQKLPQGLNILELYNRIEYILQHKVKYSKYWVVWVNDLSQPQEITDLMIKISNSKWIIVTYLKSLTINN